MEAFAIALATLFALASLVVAVLRYRAESKLSIKELADRKGLVTLVARPEAWSR